MLRVKKRDILGQIETEARRLARNGNHASFESVKAYLVDAGYYDAEALFKNRWHQAEINRICEVSVRERCARSYAPPGTEAIYALRHSV